MVSRESVRDKETTDRPTRAKCLSTLRVKDHRHAMNGDERGAGIAPICSSECDWPRL